MIDKIVSFGDSFIYGSDLSDCDDNQYSQLTWPALCAKELGLDYECHAQGARGNHYISLLAIAKSCTNALVIINWSWIDRFDYFSMENKPKIMTVLPGLDNELSKFYYKNFHSEFGDIFRSLSAIHATHSYLKEQNIPFVSSIMDKLLVTDMWNHAPGIVNLQEVIQKDISWFPKQQTFLEWSRSNGYPESKGWHPLEQAHTEAVKVWLPTYKSMISPK